MTRTGLQEGSATMNEMLTRCGSLFFPQNVRRLLTFRLMTLFVILLGVFNVVLPLFLPQIPRSTIEPAFWQHLPRSPSFWIAYNIGVLAGFWVIYTTRTRPAYYRLRVIVYGLLLGGVAGEMLRIFARFIRP